MLEARSLPSILLTCKRIHHEDTGFYFSATTSCCPSFGSEDQPAPNKRVKRWLVFISHERASHSKSLYTSTSLQRTVDLHQFKARQLGHVDDCEKDIKAIRRLAKEIYGRPVWGPEVVQSRLAFDLFHGGISFWMSDPRRLCTEVIAAHDKFCDDRTTSDSIYDGLSKWIDFLEEQDVRANGEMSPLPQGYADWAHDTLIPYFGITMGPWQDDEEFMSVIRRAMG